MPFPVRSAEIPIYVGAILQWCGCNCVRGSILAVFILLLTRCIPASLLTLPMYAPLFSLPSQRDVFGPQKEKFNSARFELHQLLSQHSLVGVPLLVVGMGLAYRKLASHNQSS